jgi:hypothetical protein
MAHDFLIFDFDTNEEAAQQARHRVEGWTQGFRLGKKMLLKFEREDAKESKDAENSTKTAGNKKKPATKDNAGDGGRVRVLIRLDFSEHEKLSHQRWLDRIPTEEPFKAAKTEIIRQGDPEFDETAELFDSLS